MANERYGLLCPICKDACYIGKTMCQGIYTNNESHGKRMRIMWTWMWKHLIECHKEFQWGNTDIELFKVVTEGHPDVNINHWNRHKEE